MKSGGLSLPAQKLMSANLHYYSNMICEGVKKGHRKWTGKRGKSLPALPTVTDHGHLIAFQFGTNAPLWWVHSSSVRIVKLQVVFTERSDKGGGEGVRGNLPPEALPSHLSLNP